MTAFEKLRNRTGHRHRIFKHLERVKRGWEKDQISRDFPLSLEIHPCDCCDLRCRFCAFENKGRGEMLSSEIFKSLVKEIITEKQTKSVVFSGGGEPALHPYLPQAINQFANNNIEVGILTNGVYFSRSLLKSYLKTKWIRISLNASNKEFYSRISRSSPFAFEGVLEKLQTLSLKRKGEFPTLGISMIVMQGCDNKKDIIKFVQLAAELKIDYVMYRPLVGNPGLKTKRPENEFRSWQEEVEKRGKKLKIVTNYKTFLREKYEQTWQQKIYQNCPVLYDGLIGVVLATGDVFPCIPLSNIRKDYSFGNLNQKSFREIWNGPKRKQVIRRIQIDNCPYCRHDHMNDILIRYLRGEQVPTLCRDPHWKFL